MSVYFIQAIEGGPIKIGFSVSPAFRLRALQASSPAELEILTTIPGTVATERMLHEEFAPGRLHGEWFAEDTPGLAGLIEVLIAPDLSDPSDVELHERIAAAWASVGVAA